VLLARWMFPPDPGHSWWQLLPWNQEAQDGRRSRHRPTWVTPAKSPVPTNFWRLAIEIDPDGVKTLRNYHWNRAPWGMAPPEARPQVLATVREGGRVYTNVSLHLKGSMGSFRPFDDKPALTLNFSKQARGQSFHGFSKISLNNSVQDPTYLSEALCRELFTSAGVPAPAATHATALINGRDLGLFVLVEGWGKPFLRKHFPDTSGNLYEGHFASEITPELEVNSGDHPEDHADLDQLQAAVHNPDRAGLWKRLTQILDVDRLASFLAMEILTCHWDGYSLNRNNYRIFHDSSTDRLVFLPHGLDQMFGSRGRMSPNSSILPHMQGDVARAFLSTREGKQLYLDRVANLSTNLLVAETLVGRARALAREIRPTLAAYGSEMAQAHDDEVEDLCRRIAERCAYIPGQLRSLPEEVRFNDQGITTLSGWRPKANQAGNRFERVVENGITLLKIQHSAGGAGSWRTSVLLGPGHYTWEGRGRFHGPRTPAGLRLRISGVPSDATVAEAGTWTPLTFGFDVGDALSTIELVCELAESLGDGEFDETSFRLVRQ